MRSLLPCPRCGRHLRRTETECPFCGAAVFEAFAVAPERPPVPLGISRAALFTLAAVSAAGTGCGGVAQTQNPSSGGSGSTASGGSGGYAPHYGAPPFSTGGSGGLSATGGSAGLASGGFAVFYGAPSPPMNTGGTPSTGGVPSTGGAADGGLCMNSFSGMPEPCCPKTPPDCSTKPDGYPGYGCTPSPGSFCSCTCEGGQWLCGC